MVFPLGVDDDGWWQYTKDSTGFPQSRTGSESLGIACESGLVSNQFAFAIKDLLDDAI